MEEKITQAIKCFKNWDVARLNTMMNQGIDLNVFIDKSKTDLLLESIVRKNLSIFKKALIKGHRVLNSNFLYLHHCVRTKDIRFVQLLLSHVNNDKNIFEKKDSLSNNNSLHVACSVQVPIKIVELLSESGENWTEKNIYGHTALHILLRNYPILSEEIVQEIKDLDFNIEDNLGITSKDILKSLSMDKEWSKQEYNINLLNILEGK